MGETKQVTRERIELGLRKKEVGRTREVNGTHYCVDECKTQAQHLPLRVGLSFCCEFSRNPYPSTTPPTPSSPLPPPLKHY